MKRNQFILICAALSLLIFMGCVSTQEEDPDPEHPRIIVNFDGEECSVTGNDGDFSNMVYFTLENMSTANANIALFQLKVKASPSEVFQSFQDGSKEMPPDAMIYGKSQSIEPGSTSDQYFERHHIGSYVVMCEKTKSQEMYLGGIYTIHQPEY